MSKSPPKPAFLEGLFTRQERGALAFLLAVGLAGAGLRVALPWVRGREPQPAWRAVAVNRADEAELASLPGIGPVTARRIVEERRRRGRYVTLSDLRRVKGVSRKTLQELKGLIRFD